MKSHRVDKPLLISIIILAVVGFVIFSSASLGLLARQGSSFSNVAFSQAFYGMFLGMLLLFLTSKIHYRFWRKYSLLLFLAAVGLTLLVFSPLGFEHGGAQRWISFAGFSLQPSEFLKIGFILYLAAWLSGAKNNLQTFLYGFLPFLGIVAVVGSVLLAQPDTDTFAVILASGLSMFLVAGGKFKHIALMILLALACLTFLIFSREYVKQRVVTFLDPSKNSQSSSYQIQQSLIAIGSGGISGKGFGQSVQKFYFLPEPIGDSVFAVASEEFGLIGSLGIVVMFIFFAFRGLKIAIRAPDMFGGLIAIGIVILIVSQAFINIAAMIGVIPLSGIPLPFISHGGTSLMVTLASMGILLNISRYQKQN